MTAIYTIGHSNQPQALLTGVLAEHSVDVLCDIRRYPQSRRNPHFNRHALETALADLGMEYRHFESLGGRRDPVPESLNTGLRNPGIRAYADYMASGDFENALADLIRLAQTKRIAIMCAESSPTNCHRSLVSDALVSRGIEVQHIIDDELREHTLSPLARAQGGTVTYPSLL